MPPTIKVIESTNLMLNHDEDDYCQIESITKNNSNSRFKVSEEAHLSVKGGFMSAFLQKQ